MTASCVCRSAHVSSHRVLQVTLAALVYTAIVTPFEVGVLDKEEEWWTPLWTLNVLVDVIFCCDIILQFFTAYFDSQIHQ